MSAGSEDLSTLPLPPEKVWHKAWRVYRDGFVLFGSLSLAAFFLDEALDAWLDSRLQPASDPMQALLYWIVSSLVLIFGYYALAKALLGRMQGQHVSLLRALGFVWVKAFPILWTFLLLSGVGLVPALMGIKLLELNRTLGELVFLAGVAALVPACFFSSFVSFVLVEEGRFGWNGIKRSFKLVRMEWDRVLLAWLSLWPLGVLRSLFNMSLGNSLLVEALVALYIPLFYSFLAHIYRDARRRLGEL
jgi:hypothetical protein